MERGDLRRLIDRVKAGDLSRRDFVRRLAAVGLTAPMATQLLTISGVAHAQPAKSSYPATKAGGHGTLRVLWWQGPTLLNPHFATGTKDQDGSRLFYEPLASWDADGNLVPLLAAELPSIQNGGLNEDGRSVTWKIRPNVKWHDGQPLTADDVVFNWQYAADPATAAVTSGSYINVKAEKVDDLTVRVLFPKPQPFWADAFVAANGMIIPKHLFADYAGSKSREAPTNLKPVGTGPYLFKSFNPGDLVSGVLNPDYYMPGQPYFDAIEMKGGGDATSAARAVLQTGEYDLGWNIQVSDDVLVKMEKGGVGHIDIKPGASVEHIQLNQTDPNKEVDGERSSIKTTHPSLTDPAVAEALSLLVDRNSVQKYIYGRTGVATANWLNNPAQFVSHNTGFEFNIAKATDLLEKAGWKVGSDGVRAKDGVRLEYLFQTSINDPRQKTQQIIKQACQKAGILLNLKSVVASVFFSSDVANPDTYPHFYSDLQMYTTGPTQPDPGFWMRAYLSEEVASKANKWQGRNIVRWKSPEYDALWAAADKELNTTKRAELFIEMNDLVLKNRIIIPVVYRPHTTAVSNKLNAQPSGWDSDMWHVGEWWKEA